MTLRQAPAHRAQVHGVSHDTAVVCRRVLEDIVLIRETGEGEARSLTGGLRGRYGVSEGLRVSAGGELLQ